jgi:hypothetical protein
MYLYVTSHEDAESVLLSAITILVFMPQSESFQTKICHSGRNSSRSPIPRDVIPEPSTASQVKIPNHVPYPDYGMMSRHTSFENRNRVAWK